MSWIKERLHIKKNVFRKDNIIMERYPNKEYREYLIDKHPELSHLSTSEINKVIKYFLELVREEIETKRDGFEITGLGHLIVISRPKTENNKILNLKKSYELDEEYEQLNLHTAGRLCKIIFSSKSKKYKIKNKRLWTFKFNASFRKKVSNVFKDNYSRFLRVYKHSGIAKTLMDH